MSSLRGHVGSLGSMPSKPMELLFLMLLITACHSHRQTVETIALSQRHQQQCLHVNDTMWQSLNLHLEGLSMELMMDSIGSITSIIVPQVDKADLTIEKHIKSETKATSNLYDTLVFNHLEKTENNPSTTNPTIGRYKKDRINNIILVLLYLSVIICILFIISKLRKK